jgi:hypothetical protein
VQSKQRTDVGITVVGLSRAILSPKSIEEVHRTSLLCVVPF